MPAGDDCRRQVVERNLVRGAFDHLAVDAFMTLPFEALGPTKALLKRYFSTEDWSSADDDALAAAVGPGEGRWRCPLDAELTLEYGWHDGRFAVRIASDAPGVRRPAGVDPLAGSFDGPVVPEATPNPRSIRFQLGPIHDGASRWYESAAVAENDPSALRLFAEFTEVANVLVGPDFVAVGLGRADAWERLLPPVLAVVTEEYAFPDADGDDGGRAPRVMGGPAGAGVVTGPGPAPGTGDGRRMSRLDRAWRDLGSLRAARTGDLVEVRAAAHGDDSSRRQVAASLLREADADTAATEWAGLVVDPVRSVRRAAADAMVDVERQGLRPLLEAALHDTDAWVRWKALRGLAQLGAGPSGEAIRGHSDDPDFRVRLEAAAALRSIA